MNESLEWQKCDEKILMLNKNDKLCLTMEVKQTKAVQVPSYLKILEGELVRCSDTVRARPTR